MKERFVSLDVLRGLTIAGMILVNTPGSWSYVFPPLRHAAWHGFTPTDLVFPFFLFAVGTAMSFSLSKYQDGRSASIKIARRTLLIFLIGVLLNTFPYYTTHWAEFRILGVLQRIALSYGIAAFLCYFLEKRQLITTSAIILLGYWLLLWGLGGPDPYSLEGNLVLTLDRWIIGEAHMYKGFGIPFEPEGILSSFPAAVNVIIGFLAGKMIQDNTDRNKLLNSLFLYGNGSIFIALFWDMAFPINKPIWTSSYVLMSSGIAMVMLAFFIYLVDIRKKRSIVSPFVVFGTNPLVIYVMSIVLVKLYFRIPTEYGNAYGWLYNSIFVPIAGNMFGSLFFALFHVFILWLFGWWLYRKKIVIKI